MGIIELEPGPAFAGQTLTEPACLTTTRPGPYYSVRVGRACHSLGPYCASYGESNDASPATENFRCETDSGATRSTRRSTDVSATSKRLRQL
jgi:hypothetical protein